MNKCKYLEETCKNLCQVNEFGTHIVSGNGMTAIYKLNKEGGPIFMGNYCPRFVLFFYIEHPGNLERNLSKMIDDLESVDIVVYSPDGLLSLLERAEMTFGDSDSIVKFLREKGDFTKIPSQKA